VGMVVVMWPDRHKRRHLGSGRAAAAVALALATGLLFSPAAHARPATDIPLPPKLNNVAKQLEHKLMCTCGCGEMLSECTCGTSDMMRETIRKSLANGETPKMILADFVKKDGTEVLSAPPNTAFNQLAWILPYSALGLTMVGLLFVGGKWARHRSNGEKPADMVAPEVDLTDAQASEYRERLEDALEDLD